MFDSDGRLNPLHVEKHRSNLGGNLVIVCWNGGDRNGPRSEVRLSAIGSFDFDQQPPKYDPHGCHHTIRQAVTAYAWQAALEGPR